MWDGFWWIPFIFFHNLESKIYKKSIMQSKKLGKVKKRELRDNLARVNNKLEHEENNNWRFEWHVDLFIVV
jgi:hypothetical protein